MEAAECTFLSVPDFFKARPAEESGRRFIYLEASNESLDIQGEIVLAKALQDQAPNYLRYGNIDQDHFTILGPRQGIPNYNLYELGHPTEVMADGRKTLVKAELYTGDSPIAARSNQIWDGMTKVSPAQKWYPSVGGAVTERATEIDPLTKSLRRVIRGVRWTNIGLSRTPANQMVQSAVTMPFGTLAKSWSVDGYDITKALEAGYGTDEAQLTGGAALRGQSIDRGVKSYFDFRDRLAADISAGRATVSLAGLTAHASSTYGLSKADASEWCERFLRDMARRT